MMTLKKTVSVMLMLLVLNAHGMTSDAQLRETLCSRLGLPAAKSGTFCDAFYATGVVDDQTDETEPTRLKSGYRFIKSGNNQHKVLTYDPAAKNRHAVVCINNNQATAARVGRIKNEILVGYEGKSATNSTIRQCFVLTTPKGSITVNDFTNRTRSNLKPTSRSFDIMHYIDPFYNYTSKK